MKSQDLLTKVLADLAIQTQQQVAIAALQAQASSTAADTLTFGQNLQAGGPIFPTDANGAPALNADGSLTVYTWDHNATTPGYATLQVFPSTRDVPTSEPGPANPVT